MPAVLSSYLVKNFPKEEPVRNKIFPVSAPTALGPTI
jgi:hypothetical protein